jgi:hypothetical protein
MILKSKSSSKESCILSLFHLKAETKNLNLHLQDSFIFNLLKSHIFLFLLLLPLLPISPSIQVSLSLSLSLKYDLLIGRGMMVVGYMG